MSVPIRPPHPLEIPPILLGGPPPIVPGHRLRYFHLQLHRLARFSPLFAFLVQLCRDWSRSPVLGDCANRHNVMVRTEPDAQRIANLKLFGPLGPLAIDLDLSGFNCRRRERPRLEESRGPQPFVEPD